MTVLDFGRYRSEMELLSRYENWMRARNASARTIGQRMDFARRCLRSWGTLVPEPERVQSWLTGYSGWTQRTYYGHLSSLFAWLRDEERLIGDPLAEFVLKAPPRPHPRPLTPAEVERVLSDAHGRLRSWLLLAALAGLRCHEVAKVRGEDVTETTFYVLGKGAQAAMLPTHPALWTLAREFPRSGWWFPSPSREGAVSPNTVSRAVGRHFRRHGIAGSIHRMRATYGTTLLRNGHNIRVVQELMRHRSLSATEHYLGTDHDELVRAIGSLAA